MLRRDVSTNLRISKRPMVRDAFEDVQVEVRDSGVASDGGAGQGLYTKVKISAGAVVALFNGIRQRSTRNSEDEAMHGRNSDYR